MYILRQQRSAKITIRAQNKRIRITSYIPWRSITGTNY